MRAQYLLLGLWMLWVLSWTIAAVWSNRTEKRPPWRAEAGYRLLQLFGGLLFIPHRHEAALRLWQSDPTAVWACAALVALGISFAWWARIHLGRLWSGYITRKSGHQVVASGPYALVRHPIYTGLILALAATAIARGTATAIAGWALLTIGFWIKARAEERWLAQELDPGAYAEYQRRVPMLLPGWTPK